MRAKRQGFVPCPFLCGRKLSDQNYVDVHQEKIMKTKLHTFAASLMLLAVAGTFCAKPAMAQARPTLVQNTDEPARAPFQTTISLNFSTGTVFVSVPIPSGKRLVIDYVSVAGAAASNTGAIQPVIILESSVAGSPS